ncbi:MAG: redoxin domain-containing protein [Acidobacteria bacterium]|nr:MAG: redoxin domain-containing protein [Acidobacteriota bacterium]
MTYQAASGEQKSWQNVPPARKVGKGVRTAWVSAACILAFLAAGARAQATPPQVSVILQKVGYVYGHLENYHLAVTRESSFLQSHASFSRHSEISLDGARGGRARMELTGDGPNVVIVSDGKTTWQYAPDKKQYSERQEPALANEGGAQELTGGHEDLFRQMHDLLVGRFVKLPQLEKSATFEGEEKITFEGRQTPCYRITIHLENLIDQLWISQSGFLVLQEKTTQTPASSGGRTLVNDNIQVREIRTHAARPPDFFTFTPPANAWRVVALELPGEREGVEGTSAGNFTLSDVEGNQVSLSDFQGKTVLMSFWATWCMPCKRELPTLQKIFEERKDVVVLTVDDENAETVRNFLEDNHYAFPALMDRERTLFRKFAVHFIPTVLVIDQEGVIVHEIVGWEGPQELLAALKTAETGDAKPARTGSNLLRQ